MSLTEALIGKAKPREKGYKLYDSPGLTLLVAPTGTDGGASIIILAGNKRLFLSGSGRM